MIPTSTNFAIKPVSSGYVCMLCGTHTQPVQSKAVWPPKILQTLLGHASIKTTMDRYVHVTDESMNQAMIQFQQDAVY